MIQGTRTHDAATVCNARLSFAFVIMMLLSSSMLASAQASGPAGNAQASHPPANITMPHQLTLTGCLRRDSNGVYSLTNENGKTFDLVSGSDTVDLSKHVFHAVSVTGKESPKAAPPVATEGSQQSPPPAVLRVLTLEVLSNSCTR